MANNRLNKKIDFETCSKAVDSLIKFLNDSDLRSLGIDEIFSRLDMEYNEQNIEIVQSGLLSTNVSISIFTSLRNQTRRNKLKLRGVGKHATTNRVQLKSPQNPSKTMKSPQNLTKTQKILLKKSSRPIQNPGSSKILYTFGQPVYPSVKK